MASCSVLVFCVAILSCLLCPGTTLSWDRRAQEGPSAASFPGKLSHGLLECSCGIGVLSVTVSPFCRASESILLLLLCWAPGGLSVDGRTGWRMVHHQSSMVPGDGKWKGPYPAAKGLHDANCRTQLLLVTSLTFQFSSKGNLLTLMSI